MRSNRPENMQPKFQFFIGELGPILAERALANGRSLTQEIRSRLRESLEREGVDTVDVERVWSRRRNPVVILAKNRRQAEQWALDHDIDRWVLANAFTLPRRDFDFVLVPGYESVPANLEIHTRLSRLPNVAELPNAVTI